MQPPSWRLVALCHVVGVIVGVIAGLAHVEGDVVNVDVLGRVDTSAESRGRRGAHVSEVFLNELADEEMTPVNMLRPLVMLRASGEDFRAGSRLRHKAPGSTSPTTTSAKSFPGVTGGEGTGHRVGIQNGFGHATPTCTCTSLLP